MPISRPALHPNRRVSGPLTRRLALGLAAVACAGLSSPAWAQPAPYPNKPVRLLVGFPAGTGPDVVARILAQGLSEAWRNTSVVVDNKPGAGGLIAATETAHAPADGYTLMLGETGQLSIAPYTYNKLPYNPGRDFAPVSQVVSSDFILLANPKKVGSGRDVKALLAAARQANGLFMATFGPGTPGHFGAYMFGEAVGMKTDILHYKNTGDALGGLYSGDALAVFGSAGLALPQVQSGKLVALGSTGTTRTPSLPDVPTLQEQGYAGLSFTSWFGIVAPAKTPPAVLAQLQADVVKVLQTPATRDRLQDAGFRVTGTTAQAFADLIAQDSATWQKAVAATGFRAD